MTVFLLTRYVIGGIFPDVKVFSVGSIKLAETGANALFREGKSG
jgi:hypothetical protein